MWESAQLYSEGQAPIFLNFNCEKKAVSGYMKCDVQYRALQVCCDYWSPIKYDWYYNNT